VEVVTRPGPAGDLLYRLAVPSCQTWNMADGLRFEPLDLSRLPVKEALHSYTGLIAV